MKIIISSKEFENCLVKAISKKCDYIDVDCLQKTITFKCEKDFSTDIHICNPRELQKFCYPFNTLKIFRVIQFLNMLNEQPVVVEFDFVSTEETDITITQTVFRI